MSSPCFSSAARCGGAARLAGITEDAVDGVMRRAVERGLRRRQLQPPIVSGVDEKAVRKGHRYATILTDVVNGRVIDLVEERTTAAALQLLEKLPEGSTASIQAVAMDMWPACIGAVEQALPEAAIVFDKLLPLRSTLRAAFGWLSPFGRLHIKKHLNEAVDKVRRQENRHLSAAGNFSLKGSKYLWLRRPGDFNGQAAAQFRSLLVQDLRTGTAWALKENCRRFWKYTSLAWAMKFLWDWVESARATGQSRRPHRQTR